MFKRIIPAALGLGLMATATLGAGAADAAVQSTYTYYGYTFTSADLAKGKPRVPAKLSGKQISQWHQAWAKAKAAYQKNLAKQVVKPIKPAPKTYTYNGFTFTPADLVKGKPRVPAKLSGKQISQWHQAWAKAKAAYEKDQRR